MKEEDIPNFRGHVELVYEYHRLRKNVRWIRTEAERQMLNAMFGYFHTASQISETVSKLSLKSDRKALWGICYRHLHFLRHNLRTLLIGHGYDPRWIVHKDGKVGMDTLGGVYPGIPVSYDEILLTYDYYETMLQPIPVRKGDKCALIIPNSFGKELTPFEYDLLFREPFCYKGLYIAVKNGKCGIIDGRTGTVVVPCEMDHIYERDMTGGLLILEKNGKYGFYNGLTFAEPVWEPENIRMECVGQVKVRQDGKWGWLYKDGKFTLNKEEASFINEDEDD